MGYKGFEYRISSMKSAVNNSMVYFAETTSSSKEWFEGIGDSEREAIADIEKRIDRYYNLLKKAKKIATKAKRKGGILYFMDMPTGEFLDCRKTSLEECVEFAKINVCYEILPDIFYPEPGVEYAILTNNGEGPGYGDRTYFVPVSELTIVKG